MDTNAHGLPKPTFGPLVPFMEEFTTPEWIEIEGRRFPWDPEQETYVGLYVEPYLTDGTLTEDIYYEIEEG
ncbi:hypothetical protein SEA_MCGALLEON_53 [Microbacterium phage McGalleon]|uniref:Uncharacterized protein n=1 Tax=Microbacterium phage McGalleon TaxID=2590936 RepID=A0A516KQY8_9CAUD|nr:hypothetical protein H3N88_gp53 [Microbacterium phage McGalleon]QDP44104.1 hypothetical protein SEA_MCGALLEON_53 [Microbacterium phage McGalleon]